MPLAVVTNYYNPSNNQIKENNFRQFLDEIKVPVYIIEVAFGNDSFRLPTSDQVIQIRCEDIIWQQYTLVNLAINRLPDRYDKAMWIDADILIETDDWFDRIDFLLDTHKMVQSYSNIIMTNDDGSVQDVKSSVVKRAEEWGGLDMSKRFSQGFSWGVQREVIAKHRIYDYWITGACDSAFCIAIWGKFDDSYMERVNPVMRQHYMEWAVPFHKYIDENVTYADVTMRHLWHGQRNYRKRWFSLDELNPYEDIRLNEHGVLEWCSNKPLLHKRCKRVCLYYDMEYKPFL